MLGYVDERLDEKRRCLFQSWIDANVPENAMGYCRFFADMMAEEFKELKVVGKLDATLTGALYGHGHSWCITPEGYVVDPTAHQYYSEDEQPCYENTTDLPIGRCLNCGELIYHDNGTGSSICSAKCGDEYHHYLTH